MLADGGRTVEHDLGDMEPGQTIEHKVMVKAERPGSFGSYAIAKSDLLEVKSKEVAAMFAQPDLRVSAKASRPFVFIGDPARFEVTVTNNGEVPAARTVLATAAGQGAEVTDVYYQQPEDAGDDDGIVIGTLQPGESRTVYVDVDTPEADTRVKLGAVATALCRDSGMELARAQGVADVEVRTIAALQLEVVDSKDPVQVGEQTQYEITVINEGSGPVTNLNVSAALPQGLKYIADGSQGDTAMNAEGQTVTFGSVPTLEAGDSVTWYITAQATEAAGGTKLRVSVKSDESEDLTEDEPTRLY